MYCSLVHEISNKLDGLSFHTNTLNHILTEVVQPNRKDQQSRQLDSAMDISGKITAIRQELAEILTSYSRPVSDMMEIVDVHSVLEKVRQQYNPISRYILSSNKTKTIALAHS